MTESTWTRLFGQRLYVLVHETGRILYREGIDFGKAIKVEAMLSTEGWRIVPLAVPAKPVLGVLVSEK